MYNENFSIFLFPINVQVDGFIKINQCPLDSCVQTFWCIWWVTGIIKQLKYPLTNTLSFCLKFKVTKYLVVIMFFWIPLFCFHVQRKARGFPPSFAGKWFSIRWCSCTRHTTSIIILAYSWGVYFTHPLNFWFSSFLFWS